VAGGNPPRGVPDFPCARQLHPGQGVLLVQGLAHQGKKVGKQRGDERGAGAGLGVPTKVEELGT
jgi:hypothetical protein